VSARRAAALALLTAGVLAASATIVPWLVVANASTSLWGVGEPLGAVLVALGAASALTALRALAGRTPQVAVGVAGALLAGAGLAAPIDSGLLGEAAGAGPWLALLASACGAVAAALALRGASRTMLAAAGAAFVLAVLLAVAVTTHPEIQVIR
jgi:hypothetical protein